MKRKQVIYLSLLVISMILIAGCSGSSPVQGKWEDSKDLVEFKEDGGFSASYYWIGGTYRLEDNKLIMAPTLLKKVEYEYEISDDTLILKQDGMVHFRFKKVEN